MAMLSLTAEEFLKKLAALYEEYGAEHYTDTDTDRNVIVIGGDSTVEYEEIEFGRHLDIVSADTIEDHIQEKTTFPNGLPTSD